MSADRWFKGLAMATGAEGLWENAFGLPVDFRLFLNPGIVFSLPLPDLVFWPTATLAGGALICALAKTWRPQPAVATALIFVVLGGLSNVVDRMLVGSVIDYLIFFDLSAVNIADGMILGGAIGAYWITRKDGKNGSFAAGGRG